MSAVVIFLLLPVVSAVPAPATSSTLGSVHSPVSPELLASASGAFAFVSNFEDRGLDGWSSAAGKAPTVTMSVTYGGEPSLASSASQGTQVDTASRGFKPGDTAISFQVAIDTRSGEGVFGLGNGQAALALVGVSNGRIVAGKDVAHLLDLGPVPTGTAYPDGWAYFAANVYQGSNSNWVMQVFVDRTDKIAATIPVPNAGGYSNAIIETLSGSAHYSDVVVSTYQIPIYDPGYNNMEGYGQGSGLLVNLLPAYFNLTAQMNLDSWNTPQAGMLSFQINAMNSTGTTKSTCRGFFQLGIDLDPNGRIAPWYVVGKNCEAVYFLGSGVGRSVPSPFPTHLVLTILDAQSSNKIVFTIKDTSTAQVFNATIPYSGDAFYGAYTQLEWQPCCNKYPIQEFKFDGSLYGIQITPVSGPRTSLSSSYMLPFVLDVPPTWNFAYYRDSTDGYHQGT